MKEIEVYNYREMEGKKICSPESDFTYKPVIAPTSPYAAQCHIAFVEIQPGKQSFSYHYHETDEEAFYIISGEGIVRTPKDDVAVKAEDVITFPAGPDHAHSICNPSQTENLVYIDFDTHNLPEITHFPDTGKVEVLGPYSAMKYDSRTGTPSDNPRKKSGLRE
jgi:uncharacterized cupin superfamily protein